jgi:iron complex transport system permease protein
MNKNSFIYALGVLVVLALAWVNLNQGPMDIPSGEVLRILFGGGDSGAHSDILFGIRLPRVLMAIGAGACLALSGYFLQLIVKNPLADPYILGTSTGAALGANLILVGIVGGGIFSAVILPSVGAIIGGFGTTLIAILLAMKRKYIHAPTLLLAGIGLASINTALISLVAYMVRPGTQLKVIIFWIMGSFERATLGQVYLIFGILFFALGFLLVYGPRLVGLWMEEGRAKSLGIPVQSLKWLCLIFASLLTSLTVAFSGAIGFVGFIIPHFSRAVFGVTNINSIWFSGILGAAFLLACDFVSRLIYPPVGLPIGIMTSFIGIPFFLYLLRKKGFVFS